jgi:hypothetical protein
MSDEKPSFDVRATFHPREVPEWFWNVIEQGRQNEDLLSSVLRKLSRADLWRFDREFTDLSSLFSHRPFIPAGFVDGTPDYLQSMGAWVVSQGREFFLRVWEHPDTFLNILEDDYVPEGSSYEGVAFRVWYERFGGDIPVRLE